MKTLRTMTPSEESSWVTTTGAPLPQAASAATPPSALTPSSSATPFFMRKGVRLIGANGIELRMESVPEAHRCLGLLNAVYHYYLAPTYRAVGDELAAVLGRTLICDDEPEWAHDAFEALAAWRALR